MRTEGRSYKISLRTNDSYSGWKGKKIKTLNSSDQKGVYFFLMI